ncbi:MAG: glycoside hydrolase N-terminal domain-containing protein [Clostridia bacterium]|nr:glycoside hydrolase N-terminal domain-containing protein [Clostridia bacterium]
MITIRKPKNALRSLKPASWWGSTWREAFPCGNGKIGAAVYGGAANDVVMINHGDLWWQGHVGVLQDVADKINDVRKKTNEGRQDLADVILQNALISKGYRPTMSYPLPLCDFKISMPIEKPVREYQRVLNMENGEVSVSFKDGSTRYERSVFVSRANNLICYEINKSGNKNIDVSFSFDIHDKFNARTPQAISKLPEGIDKKYEKHFMYFSGRSDSGREFGCVAKITFMGGSQIVDNLNGIRIKGAEKILVLIKTFVESQKEKEWKAAKQELTSVKLTYDKLIKEHTAIHSKLFSSAELDFEADGRNDTIESLLDSAYSSGDISLALAEKLWAYGRYLMISSTSPESQPCPPYGLWCGDFRANMSNIDASGQLQSMYGQIFSGNLCEYLLSIYNFYSTQIDDLKKNASRIYGCRGIMIPSVVAHGTGSFGVTDPEVLHFISGAGWICQLFYDYYLFSGDEKFLKTKALPFMKDVAMFYSEYLKKNGDYYEICPSIIPDAIPENAIGGRNIRVAANSTLDFAVLKELLKNLIAGSKQCNVYKDDIATWEYMLSGIPEYASNDDGTIKNYISEKYDDKVESKSTAVFYPVFPGTEINFKSNPDTLKKFESTATKRYTQSKKANTSGSLARFASVFARLGNGNAALTTISEAVRGMSMNNLVLATNDWRGMGIGTEDIWATYSLEANMAITGAFQEMIMQSDADSISVLPALPDDIKSGSVTGLLTRAGVSVVSLNWNKRKGVANVKLKAKKAVKISVKLPAGASYRAGKSGESFSPETGVISNLSIGAGKTVSLDIKI